MLVERAFFLLLLLPPVDNFSVLTDCLDPETRVILKSPEEEAGPDRYINANYIRVSLWYHSNLTFFWSMMFSGKHRV